MNGVMGAANEREMPPALAMETGIEDVYLRRTCSSVSWSSSKNGAAPITAGSSSTLAHRRFPRFNKLAPLLRCAIPSSEQVFISSARNAIKHTIQQCNDEADCFWREKLEGSALTSIEQCSARHVSGLKAHYCICFQAFRNHQLPCDAQSRMGNYPVPNIADL
ncbi:uncharacterized protein G6M90_00g080180 [Metarhizium brunneum]|uniref:Uncharacterized protein n=1 Tax=Metarhizium brunneum TaxID=500148 RepID=A0A7D5Z0X0_9HYPO|nr:hypothetical protein G6M90_00g080180 [Metarhizium brunneum]